MFKSLEGRTAIVTGGSKGIGRGIAKRFGEVGCNVLVVSRNQAEADAVAKEIGDHASGFQADVSDPDACEAMAKAAADRYGGIDILCANAGIFPSAKLGEMTPKDFDFVMDTNLKSTFLCVSAVLPYLKQKKSGRIVITSSINGIEPGANYAHYCSSKFGVVGLTETTNNEGRPHGVKAYVVCPGPVDTKMRRDNHDDVMEHLTLPEDVANLILFLVTQPPRAHILETAIRTPLM